MSIFCLNRGKTYVSCAQITQSAGSNLLPKSIYIGQNKGNIHITIVTIDLVRWNVPLLRNF